MHRLAVDELLHDHDGEITEIIKLARSHLAMDVAFISQFRDGKQVYLATTGDTRSFGIELQDGPPLDATVCHRMVRQIVPSVIPDTSTNPAVADLSAIKEQEIGAYVGVPLTFADGEVYGTFCCLSHEPDPALNERDAKFMAMLADLLSVRLEAAVLRRRQRDRLLQIAVQTDFDIALQPVVSLVTGELVGAEALTRFRGGLPAPDLVFNEAHELGVGLQLETATFGRSLDLAGQLGGGAYLAMNVSPAALSSPLLHGELTVVDTPARFVLELTEHVSVDAYGPLTDILGPLRARGFRLAVDDVGAGYASFHHVLQLNPDIIKIDRSLVCGSSRDGARRRIITSIVLLAMDLAATVVAEGVDDHDDLRALADLGVDAAQGYLLGQPTTDRGAVALWSRGWDLDLTAERTTQADRRKALGSVLRKLRGDQRQVDVLRAINDQLAAAGHAERISQGQYSAYEHGRERPLPVRLEAIEAVFGLESGTLSAVLGGSVARSGSLASTAPVRTSIAARLAERQRSTP